MYAIAPLLAAVLVLLAPGAARATEASTTRIETRAFYGATVTLEHGVRVYRALPPHDRVIINPGGRTPVHLGIEEHRSTTHNHYYDHADRVPAPTDPVYHAPIGGYLLPGHKFHPNKFSHSGRLVPLHRRSDTPHSGDGPGKPGGKH